MSQPALDRRLAPARRRPLEAVALETAALGTVAMVGNHLPRQCGIATFTSDLSQAVSGALVPRLTWAHAIRLLLPGKWAA